MDIISKEIILLFISAIILSRIYSTHSKTSNVRYVDKFSNDHGCSSGYYGVQCYAKELKIVGEGLSVLSKISGDFHKLEDLEISGNEDAFIVSYGLLVPFYNLKTLRIYNCSVVDIEPGAFRSLHRLQVLEISGNPSLTFDNITKGLNQLNSSNLRVFNISGNHNAANLPGAVIRKPMFVLLSNTSLKILDVSFTKLTTLLAPFDFLPHLETLNISGTLLLGSTSCFSTIISLANFSFMAVDHWSVLQRGYNNTQWRAEPRGLFKHSTENACTTRRYISENGCIITGKSIRTLQTKYFDMNNFFFDISKDMCIEENNILYHTLSKSKISKQLGLISGYNKLQLFDLSYPEVSFGGPLIKPNMFYAMPSLKVLRLAGFHLNRLSNEHIEKLVSRNNNLTELDISHNQLTYIPKKMFVENIVLEYLNISWNKLTVFETDLSPCVNLLSVDLQQNLLKVIDAAVIQHFTSLGRHIEINLKDNTLECDCELLTLTEDVNVSTAPFSCSFEGENILISNNIAHAFVQNVCAEEVERNLMTLLGALCGVLGAVVVIIAAVVIYRKRKHSAVKDTDQQNMPVIIHLKDCESMEEYPRRNPKFVVFLAYCSKDSEFVFNKIYKKLNNKLLKLLEDTEYVNEPDHLIILYDKHFLAGVDIDEICRVAITESHVTLAVVTENFLESSWCNLEVKMAVSSKVPLLPLFIMKCDPGRLTGFLRVVYEGKVRLLWPDTSLLDDKLADAEENKLLDTLCTHIMSYVQLHQDQGCNA